jgi:hypothetical protein
MFATNTNVQLCFSGNKRSQDQRGSTVAEFFLIQGNLSAARTGNCDYIRMPFFLQVPNHLEIFD